MSLSAPSSPPPGCPRAGRPAAAAGLVAALALAAACAPAPEEQAPPEPAGITVDALELRFGALPADFEVAEDEARLVLEGDGTMTVEAGERSDFGIDPVAEANAEQERFEALPDGVFLGARQLVTPIGPGAYARGRFTEGDATVEETRVFVVHPAANRLVTASYVYPAGEDSGERVQRLLELVGEIEAADAPPASPPP